jgi:virulence factor Mce-like protein
MRKPSRWSPLRVGVLVLIALVPLLYFGFAKDIPFTHGYRFKAVFPDAVNIRADAPVRIAGVNVGKVVAISPYPSSHAAVVTLELRDEGLPIHRDATLKIRPRLFLEGNFFVDLQPGSPSAPALRAGATIPMTQTASPVQLDQVLSALTSDSRADLQDFLAGYGDALTRPGPDGRTAAEALNAAARHGARALPATAIVADALRGERPDDLSVLIASLGKISAALGRSEVSLRGLLSNFDTTAAAFDDRRGDLGAAVAELPSTLRASRTALAALRTALPPTQRAARGLTAGVAELPATIRASGPWFDAAGALVAPTELGGIARDLRASAANVDAIVRGQTRVATAADATARCGTNVVLPTLDTKLLDGPSTTGAENYKEFFYALTGMASQGQSFDGNGALAQLASPVGTQLVTAGPGKLAGERIGGFTALQPLGTRPRYLGASGKPPYRPDAACAQQARPDLDGPLAQGPPDVARGGTR